MDPGIPRLPFSAPAPGSLTLKLPPLTRASHYGDAMRELDNAIGQILEQVRQVNKVHIVAGEAGRVFETSHACALHL